MSRAIENRQESPGGWWRWGILAAVAMALLSLYPQIDLWFARGSEWKGSFASQSYDEEIYAAYVNGLVLGRPRRTLPIEVPDATKPSYESFYSIQVVPAYLVAYFVRASGFSVSEGFILLTPLMAYISTLILFYLLASVTRDEKFAAVSAVGILVFGTLAARHSVALEWIGVRGWYGSFLFLRRYTHAISFPIFLLFIVLVWQAFSSRGARAWVSSIAAGFVFALLVFSYFFLWTAAVAWLACFTVIWFLARRSEWRMMVTRLAPIMIIAASTLMFYAGFLSRRDPEMDQVQVLKLTRVPDFYRAPVLIAIVVIALLLWGFRSGWLDWRQPAIVLTLSFALLPLAAFNQQIITGRTLQPDHYEMFSTNYLTLLAVGLTLFMLRKGRRPDRAPPLSKWLIALISCVVIAWGLIEMSVITSYNRIRNIERDKFVPVAQRLTQLAAEHGRGPTDREVVFSPDVLVVSENVGALAPQAPFMSMTLPFAAGLSIREWHERYFQYLYYCRVPPASLARLLANSEMVSTMSVFGYDRFNPNLTEDFKRVTSDEIREKVKEYSQFVENYEPAMNPQISYLVVYTNSRFDSSNLDRWYRRDAGELIGPFTLYQVEPINSKAPESQR